VTVRAGYEDLVTAATVGLDRRPLPVEALAGPAGEHAGVLDTGDPVAAFLDAAALLASARRAGPVPERAEDGPEPLTPAAPDPVPELSPRASAVLGYVLRGGDVDLLADLLTAAAGAGFRAGPPMLAGLLDVAVRHRALRDPVGAVLGTRGRWLAAYHPDWQRVADAARGPEPDLDNESVWETGRPAERRDWLAALRAADPAAARDRLAAGWARETGDDRATLLAVLAGGLSAGDEPFLEAALDDRKQSVRETAARLLARLPGSDFTRRATARGTPTLGLGQPARLIVQLPESSDAAAARDGISAARPSQAVGTRAWLLTQLIAAVPLAEWPDQLGLSPAELVRLPVSGGFRADVHAGWRLAAVAQRDPAWAAALLRARYDAIEDRPPETWPGPAELAAVLPPAARLEHAERYLADHGPDQAAIAVLAAVPGPWTDSLSDAVLGHLADAIRGAGRPRRVTGLVTLAARKLPALQARRDYVAVLRALAHESSPDGELFPRLRRAADTVDRRRLFLQELT
jgi:hypothetical protein